MLGVAAVVVAIVGLTIFPRRSDAPPADAFAGLERAAAEAPDTRPQVEVLNGCGVSGIAARAQAWLVEQGFDVVATENADGFDYAETIVIDRVGEIAVARRLARSLGTGNVIRQVRPDLMLQVTVILGADYGELEPFAGEGS